MSDRPVHVPTDDELDQIDVNVGPCRALGEFGPDMILASDLTAEIRRLRKERDEARVEIARLVARWETCECGHKLSQHSPLGCDGCSCLTFDHWDAIAQQGEAT